MLKYLQMVEERMFFFAVLQYLVILLQRCSVIQLKFRLLDSTFIYSHMDISLYFKTCLFMYFIYMSALFSCIPEEGI